uniref:diphthine--ammonia ligase isoform X4 n=1 Tax=Myxine glutinosa TaxID=7769 RepID=UPI00358EBACA
MRVVALVSGGKDSCYNMMCCVEAGHNIVALANLKPQDNDEIDSYMYQTVGHQAIGLYAEAMALPLYRRTIHGSAVVMSQEYVVHPGDEVEDLFELLKEVKEKEQVEAVSVGAIFSDYQRLRVENVVGTRQTPGKECRRYFATSTAGVARRHRSPAMTHAERAYSVSLCLFVFCLVTLARGEGIAFESVCLSVCLFVCPHRITMIFSATVGPIDRKFSP